MTRKHIFYILSILAILALATQPLEAQSRKKSHSKHSKKKKKTKKEEVKEETTYRLSDHLWYGGSLGLGLNAYQGVNTFGIGVAPMVGYKILPFLSAGPRVSSFLTSVKIQGYKPVNLFNTEIGAFLRAHVYEGFFLQGEISREFYQDLGGATGNEFTKVTFSRTNQYLGAGYNFGRGQGGIGTELSIMYNIPVGRDVNTSESPFSYRFGLTWRF